MLYVVMIYIKECEICNRLEKLLLRAQKDFTNFKNEISFMKLNKNDDDFASRFYMANWHLPKILFFKNGTYQEYNNSLSIEKISSEAFKLHHSKFLLHQIPIEKGIILGIQEKIEHTFTPLYYFFGEIGLGHLPIPMKIILLITLLFLPMLLAFCWCWFEGNDWENEPNSPQNKIKVENKEVVNEKEEDKKSISPSSKKSK